MTSEVDGEIVDVEVTTVAKFASERGLDHIDLLKIDIEGFDLFALRGAKPLLDAGRIGVAQFEYNQRWIDTRTVLKDVFDLVEGTPYKVGKLIPSGVQLYSAWHYELDRYFEGNYALVREDMARAVAARLGTFDAYNTCA
jgi:hypothetical protein